MQHLKLGYTGMETATEVTRPSSCSESRRVGSLNHTDEDAVSETLLTIFTMKILWPLTCTLSVKVP